MTPGPSGYLPPLSLENHSKRSPKWGLSLLWKSVPGRWQRAQPEGEPGPRLAVELITINGPDQGWGRRRAVAKLHKPDRCSEPRAAPPPPLLPRSGSELGASPSGVLWASHGEERRAYLRLAPREALQVSRGRGRGGAAARYETALSGAGGRVHSDGNACCRYFQGEGRRPGVKGRRGRATGSGRDLPLQPGTVFPDIQARAQPGSVLFQGQHRGGPAGNGGSQAVQLPGAEARLPGGAGEFRARAHVWTRPPTGLAPAL